MSQALAVGQKRMPLRDPIVIQGWKPPRATRSEALLEEALAEHRRLRPLAERCAVFHPVQAMWSKACRDAAMLAFRLPAMFCAAAVVVRMPTAAAGSGRAGHVGVDVVDEEVALRSAPARCCRRR